MLVVTRYRLDDAGPDAAETFLGGARAALAALGDRPGFRSGRIGRAADDPATWVLATEWEHVGAYRRALSAYEVKLHAVPLLSLAVDEPTAFEVLVATGEGSGSTASDGGSDRASDADAVGLGRASGPDVASDLRRRDWGTARDDG